MKKLCTFLIVIAVIMLLTACSQIIWNEIDVKEFNWQAFKWIPIEMNNKLYDKAAIFVPIQFEDSEKTFWLQLDTGANTQFDGVTFDSINPPHRIIQTGTAYDKVRFNGKIAGYETQNAKFVSMKKWGGIVKESDQEINIGTLGLDFFEDKILVLDFPNSRLAIVTSESLLPTEITKDVTYYPAEMISNFFAISLTAKGASHMIAYDTGSSAFPLLLNHDLWQQLTGRDGTEPENIIREGPAWGNLITFIGAPSLEELFLSDLSLGNPGVFFRKDKPDWFKESGIDGVMGNEPFYDDSIVILDGIGMRFGLVKVK
jgi:hypothetical protein